MTDTPKMPSGISVAHSVLLREREISRRDRAKTERQREKLAAAAEREAARAAAEEAREARRAALELAGGAPVATAQELLETATTLMRSSGDARIQFESLRFLGDALGLTRGGARDSAGGDETRALVEATVVEAARATERARMRDAMRAAGVAEDQIAKAMEGGR